MRPRRCRRAARGPCRRGAPGARGALGARGAPSRGAGRARVTCRPARPPEPVRDCDRLGLGLGALEALDRAELRRVGRAEPVGGGRVAGDDADPDLAVVGVEDVVAVAGRVHPGLHDRPGRREAAGAPGEVLAEHPAGVARQVAAALDAVEHTGSVTAGVGEVGAGDQVLGVGRRGVGELAVRRERPEAVVGALAVEQAERRVGHRGQRLGARRQVGVRAGGAGADAVAALCVPAPACIEGGHRRRARAAGCRRAGPWRRRAVRRSAPRRRDDRMRRGRELRGFGRSGRRSAAADGESPDRHGHENSYESPHVPVIGRPRPSLR